MMDERNVDVQVPARSLGMESGPARGARRKRVLLVLQYYDYRHHSGVAKYAAQAGWGLDRGQARSFCHSGTIYAKVLSIRMTK